MPSVFYKISKIGRTYKKCNHNALDKILLCFQSNKYFQRSKIHHYIHLCYHLPPVIELMKRKRKTILYLFVTKFSTKLTLVLWQHFLPWSNTLGNSAGHCTSIPSTTNDKIKDQKGMGFFYNFFLRKCLVYIHTFADKV